MDPGGELADLEGEVGAFAVGVDLDHACAADELGLKGKEWGWVSEDGRSIVEPVRYKFVRIRVASSL